MADDSKWFQKPGWILILLGFLWWGIGFAPLGIVVLLGKVQILLGILQPKVSRQALENLAILSFFPSAVLMTIGAAILVGGKIRARLKR